MHRMLLILACVAVLLASACSSHQPMPFMVELPEALADAPSSPMPEPRPEPAPDPAFAATPLLHLDVDLPDRAADRDAQRGMETLLAAQEPVIADFLAQHPEARILVLTHDAITNGPNGETLAEIMAESRAQAARDFLLWHFNLDPARVRAQAGPGASPAHAGLELEFFAPGAADHYEPQAQADPGTLRLDLRFGSGQCALSGDQYAQLASLGRFLAEHPEVTVLVEGHTDDVGNADTNQRLSKERADGVRRELIDFFHVEPLRITSLGRGESLPVADNSSEAGRQANRRVCITLRNVAVQDQNQALASLEPDLPELSPAAEYMVEVSISQCRLRLFQMVPGQEPALVRTFSVATPRPDMPAPLGWGEVTRIDFNPSWSPTANMQRRAQAHGQSLPDYVPPGSPANPMGTFKLHLSHGYGFRIHGTNTPSAIGTRASSGCIRMNNEEGEHMAAVLHVGTPVHIIQ